MNGTTLEQVSVFDLLYLLTCHFDAEIIDTGQWEWDTNNASLFP